MIPYELTAPLYGVFTSSDGITIRHKCPPVITRANGGISLFM